MSTTGTAVRYLWHVYYCLALLVLGTTPPGQSAEATKDGFLCYECSNVPKERDSLDETLGRCPGWKRAAKAFGPGLPAQGNLLVKSLYDGCMTVVLYNGTIVSQNAVVFEECLRYRKTALASAMGLLFDAPVHVHCCLGSLCNGPDNASVRRLVDRGRSSSGHSRHSDSVFYTREQTLDFYRKFFKINKTGHYEGKLITHRLLIDLLIY